MVCPSCGLQNDPDARFCNRCGMGLSQGKQAGNIPPPPPQSGPLGLGYRSPPTINHSPPIQPGRGAGIVGVARNVQQSREGDGSQRTIEVLRFRLEQYDGSGNRTNLMSVEMRSLSIVGFISDGDQVEVFGEQEGGLIRAKQIRNVTTGAIVRAKGFSAAMKVFSAVFIILMVVILAFVGYTLLFH